MKRNLFDDYQARINHVELPKTSRARIESAILAERAAAEQAPSANPTLRRSTFKPSRRWAVAAGCILAVTLGGLALAPTANRMFGGAGRSFVLAAYASGTATEASDTMKLALGNFAHWGGWYSFDESQWGAEGPYQDDFIHDTDMSKGYICSAYFDLTCEGTGIASLTYELDELDGRGPYFDFDPARDESTLPADFSRYRFTVEPGDLKDPGKGYVYLVANVPAKGALAAPTAVLDEHLARIDENVEALRSNPSMHPDDLFTQDELAAYREAQGKVEVLVHTEAAKMIADSVLTITATFDDGTSESHQYRIAPVAEFEDGYRNYYEGGHQGDPSSLFTIEQLS